VTNNRLSARELATVLAALRCFQESLTNANDAALRALPHFVEFEPLSVSEIDALCEQLNCGGAAPCPTAPTSTLKSAEDTPPDALLEIGLELLQRLPRRSGPVVPPRVCSGRRDRCADGGNNAMTISTQAARQDTESGRSNRGTNRDSWSNLAEVFEKSPSASLIAKSRSSRCAVRIVVRGTRGLRRACPARVRGPWRAGDQAYPMVFSVRVWPRYLKDCRARQRCSRVQVYMQ
jgi:hypothetical protein